MGSWLSSIFGASGPGKGHPTSITIKGTTYKLTKLLGEGGYAYVYKGQNSASTTTGPVAIKRFVLKSDGENPQDNSSQSKVLKEVEIQAKLSPHPNIVQYVAHDIIKGQPGKNDELWVVMELCPNGSMQDAMNARLAMNSRTPHFSAEEIMQMVSQVVTAICHMHSQNPDPISHWDIKLDNILLSGTGEARSYKLCDFGSACTEFYKPASSKDVYRFESELEEKMTLLYQSPESLDLWNTKDAGYRIDTQCDVWSLGVMIYVLLYHKMPFEENKQQVMDGKPQFQEIPPAVVLMGGGGGSAAVNVTTAGGGGAEKDAMLTAGGSSSTGTAAGRSGADMLKSLNLLMQKMLVKDPTARLNMFAVSAELHQIYPPHLVGPTPAHGGVQTKQRL